MSMDSGESSIKPSPPAEAEPDYTETDRPFVGEPSPQFPGLNAEALSRVAKEGATLYQAGTTSDGGAAGDNPPKVKPDGENQREVKMNFPER
jgi:hypothetical protein